jgi:hypothetical protein
MMVIADRLAQPEGTWRPYQPPMLDWLLGVSRPERPVVEPAVETPTVAA